MYTHLIGIMEIECFIIQSYVRGQKTWSGKEFSSDAAKIYSSYQDAADAIAHYWFGGYNLLGFDNRVIKIVPLTEKRKQQLLKIKAIRY